MGILIDSRQFEVAMDRESDSDDDGSRKENILDVYDDEMTDHLDGGDSLPDHQEHIDGRLIIPPCAKRQRRETSSEESMNDDDGYGEAEQSGNPLSSVDKLINVGIEYQAELDEFEEPKNRRTYVKDRDQMIWENPKEIDGNCLESYVSESVGRFKLPIDRALYILRNCEYDSTLARQEVASRRRLQDNWTEEEKTLFALCISKFGKRFKKIRAALPHRSIASIVKFYYDTKQHINYKMNIEVKVNEPDLYDKLFNDIDSRNIRPAGLCENCGEKNPVLIHNETMQRYECKTCVLYFALMRIPRPLPTKDRTSDGNGTVSCPELLADMKKYVVNYVCLTGRGDGAANERLEIYQEPEPEDDDCIIIEECELLKPSPQFINEPPGGFDPSDPNTCRMTRLFDNDKIAAHTRNRHFQCLPIIWREKESKSMEDIHVLSKESKRLLMLATNAVDRLDSFDMKAWKREMTFLRDRCDEELSTDSVLIASNRSGRMRLDQSWTSDEKKDVVRCFHWYAKDFQLISELLGTKTPEQVEEFYEHNEEILKMSFEEYCEEVRQKMKEFL
ncbi:unnamed protein product [Caenorhabditis sp. 36 PRJEB53466]|nr:unnamed protein product [Caenorhabditis sp. 36 PRJEB53466]